MSEPKSERILHELHQEIASGSLGQCGDLFMTTRELCAYKHVSLKTAFRILGKLKEEQILEKSGRYHRLAALLPADSVTVRKPILFGFLATCLESPYFAKLATQTEEIVHSVGGNLIIASSNYDFATECERLNMFCRQQVAGIFICPWASGAAQESFYEHLGVPYVMLGRQPETISCDTVLVNNQKAAQSVADHLVSQGFREFAYIGQRGKLQDQRLLGFQTGLLAHGFTLPEGNILSIDYKDQSLCKQAISQLLQRKRSHPLGLFCYHDLFATRAMNICHELGLSIPQDVAIAGFDDLPRAAEMFPPLTSVSYPIQEMVRLAFESLYARIKFKTMGHGICRYLDSKLVIRESTCLKPLAHSK